MEQLEHFRVLYKRRQLPQLRRQESGRLSLLEEEWRQLGKRKKGLSTVVICALCILKRSRKIKQSMAVNVAGDKNDNYNYKRIHSLVTGKICKGNKVSSNVCSIPTKYRTVIVPDTERKGFCSQTKRFLYESSQNENPGPGSYNVVDSPVETGSPSLSKKGTSSFVSKSIRAASRRFRVTPAANAYSPTLLTKKNFSVGNSSVFQQPIAVKPDTVKDSTPAPNQYNVSSSALGSSSNASAQSAFMSKTQRNLQLSGNLKVPSPCHYRVNDSLTKESPKTVVSSFRSTTTRKFLEDTSHVPGPAAYNPFDSPKPVQKSTLHPDYDFQLSLRILWSEAGTANFQYYKGAASSGGL
ncbi:STPG1 protein, partial [Polypterus senegalus]